MTNPDEKNKPNAQENSQEEIKEQVLQALGIDALKKEVLEEFKKERSKVSEFFKHPTILLLLGFILTTFLGTFLTALYQSYEWTRQQKFLSKQSFIEKKQASSDEVTKAIVEAVTPTEGILSIFCWETPKTEVEKHQENWRRERGKWLNSTDTLKQKLLFYFRNNGEIQKLFGEIIEEQDIIGNDTKNLIEAYKKDKKKKDCQGDDVQDVLSKVDGVRGKIDRLTQLMTEEILTDKDTPLKTSYIPFL